MVMFTLSVFEQKQLFYIANLFEKKIKIVVEAEIWNVH